jgi:hypothetical protein
MIKKGIRFMLAAALVVVSGSFAKADTYSVVSSWSTGSLAFDNLDTFTGDGTFTWNGTTVTGPSFALPTGFTNISFTFTETSVETCSAPFTPPCSQTPENNVLWTASNTDGAYDTFQPPSPHGTLDLGNGTFDCAGTNCVTIALSAPFTQAGAGATWTGLSGTSAPNTNFVSATVTDLPEPSAIAVLATVSSILGFVIFRRRKLVR